MSFVRRSSSFASVKQPDHSSKFQRSASFAEHDFFYDIEDMHVLKAGGLPKLAEMGGVQGLAQSFRTSLSTGLYEDEVESKFEDRIAKFGVNVVPRKAPATYWEHIQDALGDEMLQVLIVAGLISLVIGIFADEHENGWIEGFAILLAVIVVSNVTAVNNMQKEAQFRVIEEREKEFCVVVRNGQEIETVSEDILIGDIVVLKQGDSIVADGVFISGTDLQLDEAAITGEAEGIRKDFEHPFLLSGTSVLDGEGVMLVIAIGVNSTRGQISALLDDDPAPTPLQERLEVLANQIGVAGTGVASVLFVVLIIFWAVDLIKHSKSFVSGLPNVLQFFIISITLIVVAVPEGLPLAVTISLAYSMSKMLADNNLVRVLSACETMGNATMICSDKTGTLTQNQMTVTSVVIGGRFFRERLPTVEDIPSNLLVTLLQGEALNSKVFIAPPKPEDPPNAPIKYAGGNQTACALLRWAITLGCDFEAIRRRVKIEKAYPFSSTKKQGSVLVRQGGGSRLYVKGAVESILSRTRFLMSADGKSEPLDNDMRAKVSRTVDAMTRRGLRCIGMAFQDFGPIQYNELGEVIDHDESQEAFTLLAITGIKDPLRPGVPSAVKKCQQAGIIVRMVTGDHIETAKFIARDAGILTSPSQIAMTGPDFRAMTDSEKAEIIPRLRVLARSSPLDKEILVRWLKEQGNVVAVTGDGTNDAPALKAADVGLAMGIQGTDVAKKASSIIILDDDFSTIVKSVMWGRSVYDNIKKFVQFQITVNIIALMITLIGAFNPARSVPLTAVQLLWVNLIMDTMAALALGTEIPTMELLDRKPFAKTSSLISRLMWRNILGQSVLQLTVLLVILYSGDKIWGVPLDSVEHYTLLFNSFVWLQVFNEINSRKCNGEQNVFSGFFTNAIFVGVLVFTAVLQIILVQFCGSFAQTTPLSIAQWGECILIGAFSLPWGAVVRLVRLDDSDGQIELDPREFEVAPFPDEVDEQEMMRRKTIVGEVKNDDEDTKTPRGSTKTKKKKKHADD